MLKQIERKKTTEEKLDAELKGMKKLPRGSFRAKPGATDPRNCKVKITTYLDADVLEYFKKRSERPNAAPYQTQINNELRKVMENGSTDTKAVDRDILNDRKFLQALKKKLEAV
ncbi:MAG: BrnA antitoxin family protein [Pyrinomonadaceae bacterium]